MILFGKKLCKNLLGYQVGRFRQLESSDEEGIQIYGDRSFYGQKTCNIIIEMESVEDRRFGSMMKNISDGARFHGMEMRGQISSLTFTGSIKRNKC